MRGPNLKEHPLVKSKVASLLEAALRGADQLTDDADAGLRSRLLVCRYERLVARRDEYMKELDSRGVVRDLRVGKIVPLTYLVRRAMRKIDRKEKGSEVDRTAIMAFVTRTTIDALEPTIERSLEEARQRR